MYAVVGCSNCDALWVVEGRPETTGCPRCQRRHTFDSLKQFATAETADEAREARSQLMAARSGHPDLLETVPSYATLTERLDSVGVSESEYLTASGLDPEALAAAGERAMRGSQTSGSKRELLMSILEEHPGSTAGEIRSYAGDDRISESYVDRALDRLARAGQVTERDGEYRLL